MGKEWSIEWIDLSFKRAGQRWWERGKGIAARSRRKLSLTKVHGVSF